MTADPDYLWLMPECCADLEGRHWSVADDFDCDDGVKSTKYIRADLKAPVTSELLEAAKEVLTGGNRLAKFLIGKLGGGFAMLCPPDTDPLEALELLGAGDTYDVWCCWAAIMKLRTAILSTEGK